MVKITMMDPASYVMYGAPHEVWVKYTYSENTAYGTPGKDKFTLYLKQWNLY